MSERMAREERERKAEQEREEKLRKMSAANLEAGFEAGARKLSNALSHMGSKHEGDEATGYVFM